jgi:hypothetical protein
MIEIFHLSRLWIASARFQTKKYGKGMQTRRLPYIMATVAFSKTNESAIHIQEVNATKD